MPTITFSYEDYCTLVGEKLNEKTFVSALEKAKAELDSKLTTETSVQFNDTNLPYLWGVEGLARFTKGIIGKHKGIPTIKVAKPKQKVIYDKRLKKIRPYIACFIATGKKIDDTLLKQLIQLQEKLTENYGKKREKISIGVYPLQAISFPVHCRAAQPTEKFTPLDFHESVTLKRVLEEHPKGKEYGHLIADEKVYPVFSDSKKDILSLLPIINSEQTGKLQEGDDSLFFDTTGMNEDSVNLVANIFAYALADRGFSIEAVTIDYPDKKVVTPTLKTKTIKIKDEHITSLLGITLKQTEIKHYLEQMGYQYSAGKVTIPPYRDDIMHPYDVVEDIAIAYGYDNFEALPLTEQTTGESKPKQAFIDTQRELWIGNGYQEFMSAILSNKQLMYDKMNIKDTGTIEIENYTSYTYSCIRTWILPILLDILSKNKHVDYPQKLFEQGLVTKREQTIVDEEHLAAVTAHTSATFTEMKQAIEFVLRNSHLDYVIEEHDEPYFIPGRSARILVNKKQIGVLGEIHPAVLEKFNIHVPVAGCELKLT